MGVAGIFKKIKNAAKTVAKKIKTKAKTVTNKIVNTGAKVVKKWADVNEKISNTINKIVPGGGLITGGIKAASKLYSKIYDKIGDGAEKIIKKTSKKKNMKSQPDVEINRQYNKGPRHDYVHRRHPSNQQYNVHDIGPRRLRQPPIIDHQRPMDIQRRNYQTRNRRPQQNYPNYTRYNEAISW